MMEERKEGLEALMRDFAQGVVHQGLDNLRPEDPVSFLIAQRLWPRVCRLDLFCPDSGSQKKIKNKSDMLTHLSKKHDITGTCCKDLMRHFLEGLYPERINIMRMMGDEAIPDRQWDVERCPGVGCD
jgi:hypothetical protein